MTLERCYSSIDRYLNREDESAPRFVNVESVEDMVAIVDHYNVGENIFLTVEKYSSEDENPRIEDLLNDLATLQGNIFLTGFTTCWKLIGAKELSSQLTAIAQMSVEGHVVVSMRKSGTKRLPVKRGRKYWWECTKTVWCTHSPTQPDPIA